LSAEVAKVGVNFKYCSHFIVWSYTGLNSAKFSGAVPPSVLRQHIAAQATGDSAQIYGPE
jgi:hypothetical protein